MTVEHHPPDEVLAEYAAGSSPEPVALFVACHITLCPACRRKTEMLDAVGGQMLRDTAPVPDAEAASLVDAILGRLDATPRVTAEADVLPPGAGVLPAPLRAIVGPYAQLPWRELAPGLSVVELPIGMGGQAARIVRAAPGSRVPHHTHNGLELDLVLAGGLQDVTRKREFERGDVQWADPSVEHELEILPGEDCVVFAVNEARVRPIGPESEAIYGQLGW